MPWEIIATSHLDKDFHVITKEALEGAARQINYRPMRRMLEHDVTLPPLGKTTEAVVIELEDGEHALAVNHNLYQETEVVQIYGEDFAKLETPSDLRPIEPAWRDFEDGLGVSVDPKGIEQVELLREWGESLDAYGVVKKSKHIRKSQLPDPEIVLYLGKILLAFPPSAIVSYFLWKVGKVAADTAAEEIGKDAGEAILNIYQMLKEAPARFVREVIGTDRKTTSIAVVPGAPDVVLVVRTNDPEVFEQAADMEQVMACIERACQLRDSRDAVEVHFLMTDDRLWKLNYFLTANGSVYGSRISIAKRDRVNRMLIAAAIARQEEEAGQPPPASPNPPLAH